MGSEQVHAVTGEERSRMLVVSVALLLFCAGYAASVGPGELVHFDHAAYEDTIQYQKAGESYYDAHVHAFDDRGATFGEIRGVRQPLTFLVWRLIPFDMLWPVYAIGVVGGICLLLQRLTRVQLAVLPVASYLLLAGRTPSAPGAEQWLLVELWALLPLSASLLFWQRNRHAPAAAMAAVAVLMRETTAGFLLLALILAWRSGDRSARRSWTLAAVAAALGYATHAIITLGYLTPEGTEAQLFGSADPPRTVWEMIGWMIPGPDAVGVVVFALAVVQLVKHRQDLAPLYGVFALPVTGLVVARPYWGFLFIPFAILLFGELLASLAHRVRQHLVARNEPVEVRAA